jgi:tetratricopeptide (TPR) repeat protein
VINGSIVNLGSQYVVGLKALGCRTGDALTEEQETASGKEKILAALDKAALTLRERLGESLNTVDKFDTPLEQATTPSLEALQAYSLGRKTMRKGEFAAAVPFFQRAIRLDPNFAMAYAVLGSDYTGLGETLAAENIQKAYDLRARVSEPEKFYIESTYYHYLTGDLEKARQVYEVWSQTYPRDASAPIRLGVVYRDLGQNDKALTEMREAVRLDPSRALSYSNLVGAYMALNRLQEARAIAEKAQAEKIDSDGLHAYLYLLAFLDNDMAGMARQLEWLAGKLGREDYLLELEADTTAYFGLLEKSRHFSRRAVASAVRAEKREGVAGYEAKSALREVLYGNMAQAHLGATSALGSSTGRDVQYGTALALASAGDVVRAQALADDLAKRFPADTIVRFNYLPTIRAQLALSHNDVSKAIKELQVAAPYELGQPGSNAYRSFLYPVYLRGEAYLAAHQGSAAAAEFQKVIDHRGIVRNKPIGALAHLQLGRAYVIAGDKIKAKSAYEDFLTIWKDADAHLPILKQAKAEYARLQ